MGRIQEIDKEIKKLEDEKKELLRIAKLPTLEAKVDKYLTSTYAGKELIGKHSLSEQGFWKIRGEDPNCDLAGPHYQPDLGTYEGTLKAVLLIAVDMGSFYGWGGGGNIEKINIKKV
jgi:hypothetical protein